jgi:DNA-binding NarL/FixJ family response regulator
MTHDYKKEESLVVIVDNRTMYRAGIKSNMQSILPGCIFLERDSFNELPLDSIDGNSVYFMIRIGKASDQTILSSINKARVAQKSCKIILYDYQKSIHNIIDFFREKINGYLPDDFGESELRECVTSLAANRIHVNMQIAVELMIANSRTRPKKNPRLTPTELKVANLLVTGLSPSLIAKEMDRKISTVSTIKSNIFKKTKVNNVIDLVDVLKNACYGLRVG